MMSKKGVSFQEIKEGSTEPWYAEAGVDRGGVKEIWRCVRCGSACLPTLNPDSDICDTCEWERRAAKLNAVSIAQQEVIGAQKKLMIAYRVSNHRLADSALNHLDRAEKALLEAENAEY